MSDDDVIVCRCEDVTLGDLRRALAEDDLNVTQLKHRSRAGMGMCGGRTCRPLFDWVLPSAPSAVAFTYRLPARPLTVGDLAATPLRGDEPAADRGAVPGAGSPTGHRAATPELEEKDR